MRSGTRYHDRESTALARYVGSALTLLALISVMNCSLALDAALPVLDRCRSGRAVVTPAGLDAPVAQMPSLNLHPPPAIAQAEVHATAFPYGA